MLDGMNVRKRAAAPAAGPGEDKTFGVDLSALQGLPADVARAMAEMTLMTARSVQALGPAMAAFRGTTSPQLARAVQATENVWKGIEAEFGLLTSADVAALIGTGKSGRSFASDQRAAGKLIGIKRGNRVLFPGFQFDRPAGKVRSVVPELLRMAKDVGWDEEDLVLWLVAPSGYFHGDRPVEHLNDADLVEKARQKATVEW